MVGLKYIIMFCQQVTALMKKCLKKVCIQMYIPSCCIKLANFNKYSSLLKPLMLKFCQSEPVKVLVDGQMNTFSDQ